MTDEPDPLELIDNLQPYIESLRGVVAMFVSEGFTDEQARALTVKLFTAPTGESA